MIIRVGHGCDTHALVPGRALILGGVTIPSERGLLGHSDADALMHAVIDALLGAAGMGDIGRHFPDTDPAHRGADSADLLTAVWGKISKEGWRLGNLDATIIAQAPRLAPYIDAMRTRVADLLSAPVSAVNVKAKTNERLGPEGRGESITTHVVVLLFQAG